MNYYSLDPLTLTQIYDFNKTLTLNYSTLSFDSQKLGQKYCTEILTSKLALPSSPCHNFFY